MQKGHSGHVRGVLPTPSGRPSGPPYLEVLSCPEPGSSRLRSSPIQLRFVRQKGENRLAASGPPPDSVRCAQTIYIPTISNSGPPGSAKVQVVPLHHLGFVGRAVAPHSFAIGDPPEYARFTADDGTVVEPRAELPWRCSTTAPQHERPAHPRSRPVHYLSCHSLRSFRLRISA